MVSVRPVLVLALAGLAAASMGAAAQQVYRIVGPDGRVTFSDRPPPETAKATPAPTMPLPGNTGGGGALPFELRNVAGKYPVTLFTGNDCAPCGAARGFLTRRGIPFNERTVTTGEDADSLERLVGAAQLPSLTIGSQQLRGFAETEWTQFLDAAGYPRTSQLPPSYRRPPATPLVAVQPPPAATPPAQQAAQQPAPQVQAPAPSEGPGPSNPAGIRF
jgi:glutaredoxin